MAMAINKTAANAEWANNGGNKRQMAVWTGGMHGGYGTRQNGAAISPATARTRGTTATAYECIRLMVATANGNGAMCDDDGTDDDGDGV